MGRFAGIDALLQAAAESGAVPGAVAVVAGRDGILHEAAAGRLSVEGGAAVTTDTMFRFASMTKAMASVAALGLIEEGRLELDQPVASVLPSSASCRCWRASTATRRGCGHRRRGPRSVIC